MFSIITPTYNRNRELSRVYNSLKCQNFKKFEWIVIDDGSTDETKQTILDWQKENLFKIIYYQQPFNQGKSQAVNTGLEICNFPYTIIADSDDSFSDKTLYELAIIWENINSTENSKNVASVWTLVEDEKGNLVGEKFPKNFWQVGFQERVLEKNQILLGEKWHSWRTKVLKKQKMFVNSKSFISESATWNKINMEYDFLCINVIHRKYFHSIDGLIHSSKSNITIQKKNFYTSFYHLKNAKYSDIIFYRHYHGIAFNFIKSKIFYNDSVFKLTLEQSISTWLAFFWTLPTRGIKKALSLKPFKIGKLPKK